MAKANIVLPDGTKVDIEGSADEVAVLLSKFSQPIESGTAPKQKSKKTKKSGKSSSGSSKSNRKGPQKLIAELAEEKYFKSKRTIGDVQKKLEEMGHIYALTALSTPLKRLTQQRILRRMKESDHWVYVS